MGKKNRKKENIICSLNKMTEFERAVLLTTLEIPKGKISTYKRIAKKIFRPKAYRAVGNALHKNPFAPVIPCHRVIRNDGRLAGDKKEIEVRRNILKREGINFNKGRIIITEEMLF